MKLLCLIVAGLCAALPACADAVLIGRYIWQDPRPDFGGISALHLDASGTNFIALSDSGWSVTGTLTRDAGLITGVDAGAVIPLQNLIGKPVRKKAADSEGIAVAADGTVFIAFEGNTRVRRFDRLDGPAGDIPIPGDFSGLAENASLEALAIDAAGALYAIPERSGRSSWPFPVFRYQNGIWDTAFDIPRVGPFLVVGADIGPDGKIYVLERDFVGFGFRTRVRRFALNGTGEEVLLQTRTGVHDNLEGITLWDDGTGLRMTLVSDNNFRRFQTTEFVEYRITD